MDTTTTLQFIGGIAFGLVIGWVTYFILRRAQPKALTDLSTLIGTLGGATIIGLFNPEGVVFAGYAIGLVVGFFGYYSVFWMIVGKSVIAETIIMNKPGGPVIMGEPSKVTKGEEVVVFDWGAQKKKGNKKTKGNK